MAQHQAIERNSHNEHAAAQHVQQLGVVAQQKSARENGNTDEVKTRNEGKTRTTMQLSVSTCAMMPRREDTHAYEQKEGMEERGGGGAGDVCTTGAERQEIIILLSIIPEATGPKKKCNLGEEISMTPCYATRKKFRRQNLLLVAVVLPTAVVVKNDSSCRILQPRFLLLAHEIDLLDREIVGYIEFAIISSIHHSIEALYSIWPTQIYGGDAPLILHNKTP